MKRLAALAQHITVLNLLLAGLLLVLALFVVEPLLQGGARIPLALQLKAAPDAKKTPAAQPRMLLPLDEILVIADQNLFYQDALSRYMQGPSFGVDLGAAEQKKKDDVTESEQRAAEQSAIPPLQDYLVIADMNLFHPDRRVPPLKKPEQEIPRPEFVLYGTLVSDEISIAYMVDKKAARSTPGRGQRQTSVQLGGVMSGYTLREVLYDRVVMIRGEDRIEVKVIAPGGKKDRGSTSAGPSAPASPAAAQPQKPAMTPSTGSSAPSTPKPAVSAPVSPTGPAPTDVRTKPSQFRRTFTPSNVGNR